MKSCGLLAALGRVESDPEIKMPKPFPDLGFLHDFSSAMKRHSVDSRLHAAHYTIYYPSRSPSRQGLLGQDYFTSSMRPTGMHSKQPMSTIPPRSAP